MRQNYIHKNLYKAIIFICCFIILNRNNVQQLEDSQTFEMKDGITFTYTEPKFFDMFWYIPNDVYEF